MNLANYLQAGAIMLLALPHLVTVVRKLKAPTSVDAIKTDIADLKTGLFYVGTVTSKLAETIPGAAVVSKVVGDVEKAAGAGPPSPGPSA